ncbi:unnamed protein product [Caenorhabditis angaria]|uniref:Uncharacterized protein n=1 Tax=Caenorhabditis angaria TaxID=860376 RepID=A0A9P1IKY0_9PELO|nr:unnamed protein product [Caenorhabditis angaria]
MLIKIVLLSFLAKTCSFHGGIKYLFADVDLHTTAVCQIVNSSWCVEVFYLEEDTSSYEGVGYIFRCFSPNYTPRFNSSNTFYGDGFFNGNLEIVVGYRHNCTSDGSIREYVALQEDVSVYAGEQKIEKITILNDEGEVGSNWNKDYFKGLKIIHWKTSLSITLE